MSRPIACVPCSNYFENDNRVLRTCRFLRDRGYEVHVLAVGRADLPTSEDLEEGIHVHRFAPKTKRPLSMAMSPEAAKGLLHFVVQSARWIRRRSPALLHFNDWIASVSVRLSGAYGSTPTVYDMHELFQDLEYYAHFPGPFPRVLAAIDRSALRRADRVICVSDPIRRELAALTPKPIDVIRNIPEEVPDDLPGDPEVLRHMADGRKHLVYLGSLKRLKGAQWLLEILPKLPEEYAVVCLSPPTPYEVEFRRRASELGLDDRIRIFPPIPHATLLPTIRQGYAGISFFVPETRTLDYALPNKIFEYGYAGLPVLCSDVTAQATLVRDHDLGLVVSVDDVDGAATAIRDWVPERITSASLDEAGLTWRHERAKLAALYDDLGL